MLTQRSKELELLDLGPDFYTQAEYDHCQKKLFSINRYLGIFHNTVQFLKKFPDALSVLDVGCGGGLFLLHLSRHFPHWKLKGVDISAGAITTAQQKLAEWQPKTSIDFELINASQPLPENSVDIVLSTLVCHHLTDTELVEFLNNTLRTARVAVVIHDLHRHRLAEFFYRLWSPLFRNRLISHDGLISIRRSFIRQEWLLLLEKANIQHYQLKWFFPFRWRLILWKK